MVPVSAAPRCRSKILHLSTLVNPMIWKPGNWGKEFMQPKDDEQGWDMCSHTVQVRVWVIFLLRVVLTVLVNFWSSLSMPKQFAFPSLYSSVPPVQTFTLSPWIDLTNDVRQECISFFHFILVIQLWALVYMPSPHVFQVYLSPTPPFSTNMTIVSNDPTWWPAINSNRVFSYFLGSWRAVGCRSWCLNLTLTTVSQLAPLLQWHMIGVSTIILQDCWYPTIIFSTHI